MLGKLSLACKSIGRVSFCFNYAQLATSRPLHFFLTRGNYPNLNMAENEDSFNGSLNDQLNILELEDMEDIEEMADDPFPGFRKEYQGRKKRRKLEKESKWRTLAFKKIDGIQAYIEVEREYPHVRKNLISTKSMEDN